MKSAKLRGVPGWNFAEYLLLRAVVGLLNALTIEDASWIAAQIGSLLYALMGKRRRLALANLEKAYPGPENARKRKRVARESFRNLAVSLMEFFRIPKMLPDSQARFEFQGTEVLDRAFARGKGVIFVISHLGSWEYLAFLPFLRGYPCSVVVRETRNPYIFPWIQRLREQTQLFPIPKNGAAREILRQLKANKLTAILIDQWAGNDGLWVDFFGTKTSTTSIPAKLAARTGAALVPGYCLRVRPGHYRIVIHPEVTPADGANQEREVTEELNRRLEAEILRVPEQWTWGHKRWKHASPDKLL